MFCRRVATLTKRAKTELEELKEQHRVLTERLINNYRLVLQCLDPNRPHCGGNERDGESGARGGGNVWWVRRAVRRHRQGLSPARSHHVPLVARHFAKDRATMLAMLAALDFVRDHIPGSATVEEGGQRIARILDTSFAAENWRKVIRDRGHPGMFVRRHLEACVLTYLAQELRTGDIAVEGAGAYANWAD